MPLCGDWDGDGKDSIAVWRRRVVLPAQRQHAPVAQGSFPFGNPDRPARRRQLGRRPVRHRRRLPGQRLLLREQQPAAGRRRAAGLRDAGDRIVAGDWTGAGRDTIGVVRGGTFYLTNSLQRAAADARGPLRPAGDRPAGRGLGRQRHRHRGGHSWLLTGRAVSASARRRRGRRGLVGAAVVPVRADPASAAVTGDVQFTGHGWGHGRGLGQYGAYGYATNQGWPYTDIVTHYYGGTTHLHPARRAITVNLIARTAATWSSPRGGTSRSAGGRSRRVGRAADGQRPTAPSCSPPASAAPHRSSGRRRSPTPGWCRTVEPGNDLGRCSASARRTGTKQYRGELSVVWADGAQRTVNRVRMEDYLRGVVPRESPASWGDAAGGKGMEALKAQAVAARSYAWSENRCTGPRRATRTTCQVYGGAGPNGTSIEDRRTDAAVAATAGVVLRNGTGDRPRRVQLLDRWLHRRRRVPGGPGRRRRRLAVPQLDAVGAGDDHRRRVRRRAS